MSLSTGRWARAIKTRNLFRVCGPQVGMTWPTMAPWPNALGPRMCGPQVGRQGTAMFHGPRAGGVPHFPWDK